MKAQAKEERARKMAERDRLERETQGRIEAERRQAELEERLVEMEEEARRAHEDRLQAQRIVELLSEKVKLAEEEAQVSGVYCLIMYMHMYQTACTCTCACIIEKIVPLSPFLSANVYSVLKHDCIFFSACITFEPSLCLSQESYVILL